MPSHILIPLSQTQWRFNPPTRSQVLTPSATPSHIPNLLPHTQPHFNPQPPVKLQHPLPHTQSCFNPPLPIPRQVSLPSSTQSCFTPSSTQFRFTFPSPTPGYVAPPPPLHSIRCYLTHIPSQDAPFPLLHMILPHTHPVTFHLPLPTPS